MNNKRVILTAFLLSVLFVKIELANTNFSDKTGVFVGVAYAQDAEGGSPEGPGGDIGGSPEGPSGDVSGGGERPDPWTPINYCSNGAVNYPYCNACPAGKILVNGQCVTPNPVCTNGATNYPACNACPAGQVIVNGHCTTPQVCSNGATNWPYCNNNYCTNGATNFPACNTCPTNYVLTNGQCVYQPPVCSNGATNYPYCNNNVCSNGATNFPYCNNNYCTNGATNFPACNNQCTPLGNQTQTLSCPNGQSGTIVQTRTHSCPSNTWSDWTTTSNTCVTNTCSNGATNYPYCNNNVCSNGATNYPYCNNNNYCSNGATNYPYCNNNTCSNGATNYPSCNTCPAGQYYLNGTCTYWNNNYCSNGATNYPYCNNNQQYCSNGATNYPSCDNNAVWCNGVKYYAGYVCPTYYLTVSTTGATPLSNTATIYGYVNPQNTYAWIWFDYGTSAYNLQWSTNKQQTSNSGQFTGSLSNLQCGTRYYYRAAAENNQGVKYGATYSFVTPNCYVPPAPVYYPKPKPTIYYYNVTKYVPVKKVVKKKVTTTYVKQTVQEKCDCALPEYVQLSVEALQGEATVGKTADYRITFKNTGEKSVNNVAIKIVLPDELTIANADKGTFTKGGKTLTYTLPMLRELEEGTIILSANVLSGTKVGSTVVVNATGNYLVPSVIKNGRVVSGEATAYTISVVGDGSKVVNNNNQNSSTNGTTWPEWMPQNALEWIIFLLVFVIFLSALRFLWNAFSK